MHEYIYYKGNKYTQTSNYSNYTLGGSITHYYHFLLGFLIPFLLDVSKENYKEKTYIFDDIFGPMTRILLQLPFDIKINYTTTEKYKTRYWIPLDVDIDKRLKKNTKYVTFTYKNYITINKLFTNLFSDFNLSIPIINYDIIIIERKKDLAYKTIDYKKGIYSNIFKLTGSERRSIINFDKFYKAITEYYPSKYKILETSLEYISFFQQYLLFNNAKIVILQHGAAVSNLIFMKPKTIVIELIPSTIYVNTNSNIFYPLSETCKIKHYQYITPDCHVNIDIPDFINFLNDIKNKKIKPQKINENKKSLIVE